MNLKSLTLTGHIVTAAGLKHLASLKKLEKLQLRGTVSVDALRQLGEDLPSLVSLTIDVSSSSLPSLQTFTNLEGLHLFADGVSDAALLSLQTLNNLKSCRIEGGSFTAAGIAALQKKLPDCMIVAPDIAATTSQ